MCERKTEDEYSNDYVWIDPRSECIRIVFHEITWDGPHTSNLSLKIARELPSSASQEEVHQAISDVLKDPKFFQVCLECKVRKPLGLMYGDICMACAGSNHGIMY